MCVRAIGAVRLTSVIVGLTTSRANRVALLLIRVIRLVARAAIGLGVVVRTAENLVWKCDVVHTWRAVRWCLRVWRELLPFDRRVRIGRRSMMGRIRARKGRVCALRLRVLLRHGDGFHKDCSLVNRGRLTMTWRGQATCESSALRSALACCKCFSSVCDVKAMT